MSHAAGQFLTSGTRNAAAHEFSKARQYLVWLAVSEAAQLTITRSDRVRWASAVQYATAWAASSTGLL
jgi:hypothetical protein